MKKLISLLLAALMVFACTSALAEDANTYALNEDTLTLEQGPVWYFLSFDESTGEYAELHATPDWGDNWQFSEQPEVDGVFHSICEWEGVQAMPGTWLGNIIDIVAAFKAPKAGTITIAPMEFVVKDDGEVWPAYLVNIAKAAGEEVTKLFPQDEDFAETPVTTEAITVDVAEGDFIYFTIRATGDGGAAVSVMPVITYAE